MLTGLTICGRWESVGRLFRTKILENCKLYKN